MAVRGLAASIRASAMRLNAMAAERRGDHTEDNPAQLGCRWHATGGQHGSAKSKWKSKDGMLPLDHFQSGFDVGEKGHRLF